MSLNHRLLDTRRWTPPKPPANEGRSAITEDLVIERRLPTGGTAPEDVMFDSAGRIITGLDGGRVIAIDPNNGDVTTLGNTGGRPLGVQPSTDGSVLVCDHDRGLLRVKAGGAIEVLVDSIDGQPLTFASNVVEGSDGRIWFTTSSSRWDLEHHLGDVLEHACTGRLVEVRPDGTVTTLIPGLAFGNGLVLAPDESHLLYAETAGYRISRYWLTGPKAGQQELFADNLHGLPDNMSLGSDGLLWVSLVTPRNPVLDTLLPLPGFLRTLVWNLPKVVQPKPARVAWVMAYDLTGRAVHDLRLDDGDFWFVTAVAERDGVIALSSLEEESIALVRKS